MLSPVAAQIFSLGRHVSSLYVNALAVDGEGWLFAGQDNGLVIRWETWPGAAVAAVDRQRLYISTSWPHVDVFARRRCVQVPPHC